MSNKLKKETKEKKNQKSTTVIMGVVVAVAVILIALMLMPRSNNVANEPLKDEVMENEATAYADIEIEDYGTVSMELYGDTAPKTVENFIALAESGFYDGLTFHRIKEGFMMQGGDPNGNGTGGSETTIVGEFSSNGHANGLSHTRGTVSMARAQHPDSASSQFFIVHEDSTFLDGQYAAFGFVTEGMEIVDEICESAKPTDNNGSIPREEQPVIKSITIRK